ncbi:FANTASTIC four-like protein [Actinidia rufa]|uniref:FANTASTIC four-like protein n=1 Tax=Actinidia rufa TaxID=165716 RepID=A0A7J0GS86_9ERIC|nr:FANTASTIC four-like protein [Actinidia rufa]
MSPIVYQGLQSCLEPNVLRHKNAEFGSFIQSPTNISHNQNELMTEKEKVYVHPLSRRSSSPTLSKKSLEMCTESLGCETGSDSSERSDEFSLISSKTSISDSDCFRVRHHREGGRLVIKAVTISSSNSYFQAERVDGRLRFCLVKCNSLECEEAEEKEEDAVADGDEGGAEDMEGNSENVGGEIGTGEVLRPSRCKEGGRGRLQRGRVGAHFG